MYEYHESELAMLRATFPIAAALLAGVLCWIGQVVTRDYEMMMLKQRGLHISGSAKVSISVNQPDDGITVLANLPQD